MLAYSEECVKISKEVDLQNWVGYENESFNAEFMWSNKLAE